MADSTAPELELSAIERSTLTRAALDASFCSKHPHIFGPGARPTGDELRAAWPEIVAASEAIPPMLARRELLPLNSGSQHCAPHDIIEVEGTPGRPAFRPERLFIQNAHDWEVVDILIDGKTQFLQPGPIPGAVFAAGSAEIITFDTVQKGKTIRIVARNVGDIGRGPCPFVGGFLGTSAIDSSEL